ncbi:MAG: PqiC family protein [Caldimonas sp.]
MTSDPVAASLHMQAQSRFAQARLAFAKGLAMLVLAGCGSTPVVHFHTLAADGRPPHREGAPAVLRGPAVVLEPVKVPVQVDQPQWLVRLPDGSMALLEQDRWSAPLRDEFQQALLEWLTQRFGVVDARVVPSAGPLWRVRVDITRFESSPGEARMDGTWVISTRAPESVVVRCSISSAERADGGMEAVAQAHRRAVAKLGDQIGEQLLALQRGETPRCVG